MNVRLSFLLVAVLLIFGGTVLGVWLTSSENLKSDQPWLYRVDENTLAHIKVSHNGQIVNYVKRPGGTTWFIQGNPDVAVFAGKWGGTTLLLTGPRVNRLLDDNVGDLTTYGLAPPRTTVKLTDRSGLIQEFYLGSSTPDGANQYASLEGSSSLFTVPEIWGRVVGELATEPPYPPQEDS
jgi:hypothetical protein